MKNIFNTLKINNYNAFFDGILPNPDTVLKRLGLNGDSLKDLLSDSHVWSCVQSRKSGVISLDWDVGENTINLKQIISNLNYESSSKAFLNAILYGFSVIEIIWEQKQINNQKLIVPTKLNPLPISNFGINSAGELQLKENQGTLPKFKTLLIRNESDESNPYGESVLSRCYWPVKFKNSSFRFWASYMEKFGSPVVIGKYPRGTSNEDAEKLLEHLSNLADDSAIVSPNDIELELKDANNHSTSAMYSEMIDKCNAEISKAILSQTLTTEVNSGSKAAAETHLKVRKEIIEQDARLLESAWNDLINIFYEINFSGTEIPKFNISKLELESTHKLARDKALVKDCGLKLANSYWARNYNIPESEIILD
jgi:phage gp29-like protein